MQLSQLPLLLARQASLRAVAFIDVGQLHLVAQGGLGQVQVADRPRETPDLSDQPDGVSLLLGGETASLPHRHVNILARRAMLGVHFSGRRSHLE